MVMSCLHFPNNYCYQEVESLSFFELKFLIQQIDASL